MNHFENLIGYSAVKKELELIADILRNTENYKKLGVKAPAGLLLHGEPGLGKTLMANCLINASGRKMFCCRKDRPDGEFVDALRQTFAEAKESAPSIVFLDDMDKFANGDEMHRDAEEYVAVQACIDSVKNCDVFVLATANSLYCLPDSLLRAGRFDKVVEIESPYGEDAVAIIKHYMSGKNFSPEVDPQLVARLMDGNSCAELEAVINEAGLYAGYERCSVITKEHFLKACMRMVHNVPIGAYNGEKIERSPELLRVACHEAGHAVIQEILEPGSVTLVSVYIDAGQFGGFAACDSHQPSMSVKDITNKVLCSLGGRAASEQFLGIQDVGSSLDLRKAYKAVEKLVKYDCVFGFQQRTNEYTGDSEALRNKQEIIIATEVDKLYKEAKRILLKHSPFFDRVLTELMDKQLLDMNDIKRIRKECMGD